MKVAIIKERRADERRVAASPDSVKQMVAMGLEPVVESGAGAEAYFSDAAYSTAGAAIVGDAAAALAGADIVLKVQRPLTGGAGGIDELQPMPRGAARMLVMGAGVAGLQAIATARRLGAIVSATDVRAAAKEQVESLGASFLTVDLEAMKAAETTTGYAKEMSEDYQRRQREKVTETLRRTDIVICTALIPGRKAPVLITAPMVADMRPGSVIVDLAVEQGGNCEGSRFGEVVTTANAVKLVGHANVPSRIAVDASQLYARNIWNFLALIIDKDNALKIDLTDEIIKGTLLTKDGAVVHPALAPKPGA